jgi:hypothetical protein
MNFQLTLHETPPSLNRFTGGSRGPYHRAKKQWEEQLGVALMAEAVPRDLLAVQASAVLTFPQRRRRDEGNMRFLLEKALGDMLVRGGWLPDDTSGYFSFLSVTLDPETGRAKTVIDLEVQK